MANGVQNEHSEALYQSLKFSPYPKAIVDADFNYIAVSDEWRKTYGLEGLDLIGKCHYDFFPEVLEHRNWLEVHKRVLQGETIEKQRDQFVREDGSIIYLEWLATPWYMDDEDKEVGGLIMCTKDITDSVLSEQKLEQLNLELENRVKERTRQLEYAKNNLEAFSYSVSHDLRSPLRAINGFGEILQKEHSDNLDEEGIRYVNIIRENAIRMGRLIDDVLEFSRVGRGDLKVELIDLKWLAKEILSVGKEEFKDLKIEYKIAEMPEVQANLPMMKQMLENLISNAIKYSSHNSEVYVEMGYIDDKLPDFHTFYVKDNGIGLDMKYADKIFGVFERLHSEGSYSGTGVGLAIVKKIIEKHMGTIWVESKAGQGSCFYFTLPAKQGNNDRIQHERQGRDTTG